MTASILGTKSSFFGQRFLAIVATGFTISCVVSWLFFLVQEGFLISGRGAVRDNFEVSVVKPPLQYWLTTLTLPRFKRAQTAVRIWPLLFGTLTAIATGWLPYLIEPKQPWLIPLSVGLLQTCPLFLMETSSGRLDPRRDGPTKRRASSKDSRPAIVEIRSLQHSGFRCRA